MEPSRRRLAKRSPGPHKTAALPLGHGGLPPPVQSVPGVFALQSLFDLHSGISHRFLADLDDGARRYKSSYIWSPRIHPNAPSLVSVVHLLSNITWLDTILECKIDSILADEAHLVSRRNLRGVFILASTWRTLAKRVHWDSQFSEHRHQFPLVSAVAGHESDRGQPLAKSWNRTLPPRVELREVVHVEHWQLRRQAGGRGHVVPQPLEVPEAVHLIILGGLHRHADTEFPFKLGAGTFHVGQVVHDRVRPLAAPLPGAGLDAGHVTGRVLHVPVLPVLKHALAPPDHQPALVVAARREHGVPRSLLVDTTALTGVVRRHGSTFSTEVVVRIGTRGGPLLWRTAAMQRLVDPAQSPQGRRTQQYGQNSHRSVLRMG
mmetsp:Transcript_7188/g.18659  ORF Transcript_7188/g.18659 Transcript_7188/m.18659 type:complete len:376 (+) Transcript_7188:196-1323(+)